MLRSYKFRLYTTAIQDVALTGMLGAFCDLYNAGLQQRIEAYQRRDVSLRYSEHSPDSLDTGRRLMPCQLVGIGDRRGTSADGGRLRSASEDRNRASVLAVAGMASRPSARH
jgi:transposase